MMIKDSLYMSIPIMKRFWSNIFSVRRRSQKWRFGV